LRFNDSDGLAGEAIAARRLVVCADTENDSRVDRDLCLHANLRSCVIVPICCGDEVIGVLQAFSAEPHAFTQGAASLLQQTADFISSLAPSSDLSLMGER
ncbi:MAG: GAF domain-containing protein, partial [Acidobacteriaceae bacterium]|nr:GAF domain-containing protein [Acidobacteriaceae bacterium]